MKINRKGNAVRIQAAAMLSAVLIFAGSVTASAQEAAEVQPAFQNTEVRHLGNIGGSMMFQIKLDNSNGDRFSVVLKNKQGQLLFHSTYNDKNFDKKYKIDKPQSAVVFQIKNLSKNTSEAFEINTATKVIEEVSVTRVTK